MFQHKNTLDYRYCTGLDQVDRNYYINKFARGVGGNWSAAATWSTTSGGIADTTIPTASDDVFLDASSGQVTIDATSVAKSVTCTGYTNTLTHNAFSLTISGSLTLVAGMTYAPLATSSLVFNATGTLTTGGKLLPLVSHTSGSLTLGDNVTYMASKVITLKLSGTALVLNGKTLSGNSSINRLLIQSGTIGTGATITVGTGTFANADFMDITFSSASDVNLSAITGLSGDCGGNTLTGGGSTLTFTTSTTQTATMSVSKNWSDVTIWTSRVPLPQDDVVMTGVTGGTLTADMPRLGRSIDWTSATGSPTWGFTSVANSIFGSATLISGMTISGTQITTLAGRGSYTLTSAGQTYTQAITIAAPTGTYMQNDAFMADVFVISIGTFTTNDFNLTINKGTIQGANTSIFNAGTSLISMTGAVTANCWNCINVATVVNASLATFAITTASNNTRTFVGNGKSYGTLTYTVAGSTGALVISGSNTFNTINFSDSTNARTLTLTNGTTQTITGAFNVNGTTGKLMTINSSSAGNAATLLFSGNFPNCNFLSIQDNTVSLSGFNPGYAGSNSTLVSNTTNWVLLVNPRTIQTMLLLGG